MLYYMKMFLNIEDFLFNIKNNLLERFDKSCEYFIFNRNKLKTVKKSFSFTSNFATIF